MQIAFGISHRTSEMSSSLEYSNTLTLCKHVAQRVIASDLSMGEKLDKIRAFNEFVLLSQNFDSDLRCEMLLVILQAVFDIRSAG